MPNLAAPVRSAAQAAAYRDRIRRVLPDGSRFQPLMTPFLTEDTIPKTSRRASPKGLSRR